MRYLRVAGLIFAFAYPVCAATFGRVIPIGGHVSDLAYDNRRGVVYIANFTANRIEVLSTSDHSLRAPIYVSPQPATISMSPDGRFLVVGHFAEWTTASSTDKPAVTVLDLDGNVRQTLTLSSSPLAVAFGAGSRALIVTRRDFQLLDPLSGALQVLAAGATMTVEQLPVAAPKFPPEIVQASTGVSGDGEMIYVLAQGAGSQALVQFRPSDSALRVIGITSSPQLGPRVVSVNRDGSRYLTGWALVTPSVVNLAQFPHPTGQLDLGTHAFDWSRNLVYAQIPTSIQPSGSPSQPSTPTPAATLPVLHIVDADNLTVRERLQIRENLAGRSVFSPDMRSLYSASDSGVTVFPLDILERAPRIATLQEDLFAQGNACDRRTIVRDLDIIDPSGAATDFSVSGARSGVSIFPSSGTTPARVRVEIDPTVFQDQKGTTALQLTISSNGAINIPAAVRLLINTREPEQRGTIVNVAGKLVDVIADSLRHRVYVLRQDRNVVLVFDSTTFRQTAALRTGNTPTQMAITRDSRYLIVGNDNSQIANVYDLETLRPSAPIVFPPGHYPRSIAVGTGDILASIRSAASPEHKIDRIDFEARTATELPSLGVYKNDVHVDTVLTASPSGRMILIAAPTGNTMLYDSEAGTFVAARNHAEESAGALAALSDGVFVVDTKLLNSSLVAIGRLESATGQSSGISFIDSLVMRTTTPAATSPGVIQRVNASSMENIRPTRMIESPINTRNLRTPDVGLVGQTILPFMRTLAPLPARNSIVSLSASGLSVLPWDYDAALAQPILASVANDADGSSAVASGGLITVRGSNLASAAGTNTGLPVATTLGESCLTVNGVLLPMFSASADTIRAQLPFSVSGPARMLLRAPGGTSNTLDLTVHAGAPAIFRESVPQQENTVATVYRASNLSRVTFSNPIHPEDIIHIVLIGLGRTSPAVEAGEAAPSDPLAQALLKPEVKIAGADLEIHFAGLVPNEVGVYQITAKIPFWVPIGRDLPLTIRQGTQATTLNVRVVN
jgi:uncharacterized protein (TIGR03437 family)